VPGKKMCKYPEFNVDFVWATGGEVRPPKKRQKVSVVEEEKKDPNAPISVKEFLL
jgi:hypothetical protein